MAFLDPFASKSQTPVHPYFPGNISSEVAEATLDPTEELVERLESENAFLRELVFSLRVEITELRKEQKPVQTVIIGK